jgi:hypothetical protein
MTSDKPEFTVGRKISEPPVEPGYIEIFTFIVVFFIVGTGANPREGKYIRSTRAESVGSQESQCFSIKRRSSLANAALRGFSDADLNESS